MIRYLLLLLSISLLWSCGEDCTYKVKYFAHIPHYTSGEELLPEIKYEESREIENPGKIYYYGTNVLINEVNEGVHVIDNSNVRAPQQLGFISIPGNLDISLRGNYLYADDYHQLMVIDIEDLENPTIVATLEGLKNNTIYFDEEIGAYLTHYESRETELDYNCGEEAPFEIEINGVTYYRGDIHFFDDIGFPENRGPSVSGDAAASSGDPQGNNTGGGGSLARMAFIGDYFYYVNEFEMHVIDVHELAAPEKVNLLYLEWGVETIFPYEDKIFIGANNGMHILDNSDPTNPQYLSTFRHARACDPVFVSGDIAYVTLRDGTECTNFTNQLDVVDVSNLLAPELIASYPMTNPHGLSVSENNLYLCDGRDGLKVFDVSNVEEIDRNLLAHVRGIHAYDVISVTERLLLLIGSDGFYQFDMKDPSNPDELSHIAVDLR